MKTLNATGIWNGSCAERSDSVEDEFGDVEFDRWSNVLAVTTPPMVFDELDLGRFRIELHLDELASDAVDEWYRIEAIDPNPSAMLGALLGESGHKTMQLPALPCGGNVRYTAFPAEDRWPSG